MQLKANMEGFWVHYLLVLVFHLLLKQLKKSLVEHLEWDQTEQKVKELRELAHQE